MSKEQVCFRALSQQRSNYTEAGGVCCAVMTHCRVYFFSFIFVHCGTLHANLHSETRAHTDAKLGAAGHVREPSASQLT